MKTEITCRLRDCETLIAPDRLFCRTHWRMVPGDLQDRILYAESERRKTYLGRESLRHWRREHATLVKEATKAIAAEVRTQRAAWQRAASRTVSNG